MNFTPNATFKLLAIASLELLAFASTAWAQIEPGLPGSIEYSVLSNNQTWLQTTDPIATGTYVQDLLTDRLNQPDGRGSIGIVTDTGFDPDYGVMAATVDFGATTRSASFFPSSARYRLSLSPPPPRCYCSGCWGVVVIAGIAEAAASD